MVHEITDTIFSTWLMDSSKIILKATGTEIQIQPIKINKDTPGKIIYQI